MTLPTRRTTNSLAFALILSILAVTFYVEYVDGAVPCPLCMVQRFALVAFGVLVLVAAVHNARRWGNSVYGLFMLIFSIIGFLTAGRQLWLQSLPPSLAPQSCGVDIYYLLQVLPFDRALSQIFQGSAECAQVSWSFLGLSMAGWSFMCFLFLVLVPIRQFKR